MTTAPAKRTQEVLRRRRLPALRQAAAHEEAPNKKGFKVLVNTKTQYFTDHSFHPAGVHLFIMRCAKLSPSAKQVMSEIYQVTEARGQCNLPKKKLAEMAGCTLMTINRAVKDLEAVGLISVERRFSEKGRQLTSVIKPVRITGETVVKLQPTNLLDHNWYRILIDFEGDEWVQENCPQRIKDWLEETYRGIDGNSSDSVEESKSTLMDNCVDTPNSNKTNYVSLQTTEAPRATAEVLKPTKTTKNQDMRKNSKPQAGFQESVQSDKAISQYKKQEKYQAKHKKNISGTVRELDKKKNTVQELTREGILLQIIPQLEQNGIRVWYKDRPVGFKSGKDEHSNSDFILFNKFCTACAETLNLATNADILEFLETWIEHWEDFIQEEPAAGKVGFAPAYLGKSLYGIQDTLRAYVPKQKYRGTATTATNSKSDEELYADLQEAVIAKGFKKSHTKHFVEMMELYKLKPSGYYNTGGLKSLLARVRRFNGLPPKYAASLPSDLVTALVERGCTWLKNIK